MFPVVFGQREPMEILHTFRCKNIWFGWELACVFGSEERTWAVWVDSCPCSIRRVVNEEVFFFFLDQRRGQRTSCVALLAPRRDLS